MWLLVRGSWYLGKALGRGTAILRRACKVKRQRERKHEVVDKIRLQIAERHFVMTWHGGGGPDPAAFCRWWGQSLAELVAAAGEEK